MSNSYNRCLFVFLNPRHSTNTFCLTRRNESRCECVQAGTGRDYSERKRLSQTHQDLGAVRRFHEDPQRSEKVSLTDVLNKHNPSYFIYAAI